MFSSFGRLVAVSLWAIPMGFSGFYAENPQESGQIQKGHLWFSPIPLLLKVYAIPKWTQYIYKHLENILFLTNRTRWQRTNRVIEGQSRSIKNTPKMPTHRKQASRRFALRKNESIHWVKECYRKQNPQAMPCAYCIFYPCWNDIELNSCLFYVFRG